MCPMDQSKWLNNYSGNRNIVTSEQWLNIQQDSISVSPKLYMTISGKYLFNVWSQTVTSGLVKLKGEMYIFGCTNRKQCIFLLLVQMTTVAENDKYHPQLKLEVLRCIWWPWMNRYYVYLSFKIVSTLENLSHCDVANQMLCIW